MTSRKDNLWYTRALDMVKLVLQWLIVSVLGYAYWLIMLLLASLFLNSVWHVRWEQLLQYSGVLAAITAVVYAGILWKRNRK